MTVSQLRPFLVGGLLWLAAATPLSAATVTIQWDPSPSPGVTNYNVFIGTQLGSYGAPAPIGNRTTWTFTGLQSNVQYYFAVQAQSASGVSDLAQIGFAPPALNPPGSDPTRGDFNGDGWFDLLWKQQTTGTLALWHLNNSYVAWARNMTPSAVAQGWELGGSADFNQDGKPDLIWQNLQTGQVVYWLMDGAYNYSAGYLAGPVDPSWRIASIGDFNGDGSPDIWWRNQNTGEMLVWYFNGVTLIGAATPSPASVPDLNWKLRGTADFTGDGRPDALWQNDASGELRLWVLNGITAVSAVDLTPSSVAPNWRVVALGDANLDGHPDIFWENDVTGALVLWTMNGTTQIGGGYLSVPFVDPTWKIMGPK